MSDINEFDESKGCGCSHDCTCGEHCECNHEHRCSEDCTCGDENQCRCENCDCGEECACESHGCNCNHECECGDNCECDENCKCSLDCDCGEQDKTSRTADESEEELGEQQAASNKDTLEIDDIYAGVNNDVEMCECDNNFLKDYQRVQAEFDNYRKRMQSALLEARHDGFMDAITSFLPALDSFKMAAEYITDQNTLMGIKFIEKGILDTLSKIGVEAIDATGKFNPDLHQAIEAENAEGYESGDIIKEAYKGFTYKGKVIRYSQVIVQK